MPSLNNGIPYVPENVTDQAAAINVGFDWIDALLQLRVVSVGTNSPPGSPANGARYIVGTSPTGAWAGQANRLARWRDGIWQFFDAVIALNAADGNLYVRQAGTWAIATSGGGGGGGTVTQIDVTVPTGLAVAGVPITTTGTVAITYAPGYSIPTNADQLNWSTAYGWGDHAAVGYALKNQTREKLTAARTYYVRSDGNDANDGLADTSAGAFLTMQKASDTIAALDLSIYNVTVQVTAGVFESAVYRDPVGSGNINVFGQGDTTIFRRTATSGAAISFAGDSKKWRFNNLQYEAPNGDANGVVAANNQQTQINNCTSGVCTAFHLNVAGSGVISIGGTHTIKGNAQAHWLCSYKGGLVAAANITLVGSIAFSQAFAICQMQALIRTGPITFTGSATGQRFTVGTQAQINVNGAGLTYLPGSTAGVIDTATGGLYI